MTSFQNIKHRKHRFEIACLILCSRYFEIHNSAHSVKIFPFIQVDLDCGIKSVCCRRQGRVEWLNAINYYSIKGLGWCSRRFNLLHQNKPLEVL